MAHAVFVVRKCGIPVPRAYALKRSSPATNIAFLIAARVESYSTVTSLPQQPRRIRQVPSAIGFGFCEIIEKRLCRAPRSTIVLQLRNGLGTVPENDSASLHQRAARDAGSRFLCCCRYPFLLQHSKCACRPLRRFANRRSP